MCVGNDRCNPRPCPTPAPPTTKSFADPGAKFTEPDVLPATRDSSQVTGGVVGAILASLCCLVSLTATVLLIRLNLKQNRNEQEV